MRERSESGEMNRRNYLRGAAIAAGALALGGASEGTTAASQSNASRTGLGASAVENRTLKEQGLTSYSRYKPSFGGPVNSPEYLGKLVPGLRGTGLPPVPVTTVDGSDLPWKMVGGVKDFDLVVEPVTREFLPEFPMHVWGYNGSMPGPTIQVFQGDRVRINVHNRLPEVTTVHWHGLELPNRYDGIPGVTQPPIKPGETFVYEFDLH
ncbi:MAG: multicopper oxidase domain-containing protein, partial [Acidobacteriota bacterium]|nr:multicopper oxidase domain-containing protein [Acidobacteriota bacterium]